MRRTCTQCGVVFDGRSDASLCSARCRKRAQRARQAGTVVGLGRPTPIRPAAVEPVRRPVSLAEATRRELEGLGAADSPEGMALLLAAERLDARDDSAAGLAALMRQHAQQMAAVRAAYARPERDVVDELMDRRAGRGA